MAGPDDRRFLDWRLGGWYARVTVPPSLRQKLGKQHLYRSLGTADLKLAQRRRWRAVEELKARIEKARQEP